MNRQRQIIVTVTYNDLGIIVDAKAEPRKPDCWRWIPCSEKVPETDEVMLVTAQPKKGAPNVNRAYYMNGHWHGSGSMSNVVAWMPLPAPYRGGGEE